MFASVEYGANPKDQAVQFKRDLYRFYAVLNITHILGQFSHVETTKLMSLLDSAKRQFAGYCEKVLHMTIEKKKDEQ